MLQRGAGAICVSTDTGLTSQSQENSVEISFIVKSLINIF